MSDWNTDVTQEFDDYEEIKPKWLWLIIGYTLTILMLVVAIFFRTSGEIAWISYIGLWIVSLATYLTPFALFAMKDFDLIAKNPNADPVGRQNLPFFRTGLLLFGFVVSMIFVYLAAEEISRNLNAVT
jgi:hypothetical protein